ncbi:MAG: helix-turn-helix domain-containing protein [Bacteroidota bacterium]
MPVVAPTAKFRQALKQDELHRMFYQKYTPNQLLKSYVECYYIWECDVSDQEMKIVSPPSAFTSIVFNYGTTYSVNTKNDQQKVPNFFLTGQATKKYELKLGGKIGMLGIVFLPAALTTLFQIPIFELVDERVDLRSMLGKELEEMGYLIAEEAKKETKIKLVEAFLIGQVFSKKVNFNAIDRAANTIVAQNGQFSIDQLIQEACMSRRQFERKFYRKVGLSPKYYGRIRRIGYICSLLASGSKIDLQDIIYDNGYFDQAHFIREFKEFLGETPAKYIKSRLELAHLLRKERD